MAKNIFIIVLLVLVFTQWQRIEKLERRLELAGPVGEYLLREVR